MIRAVLVGWSEVDWRLYRQPQWMAEVRQTPEAARLPRRHFDVPEEGYRTAIASWQAEGAGAGLTAALALLGRSGAVEVAGPGRGGSIGP